MQKRLNAFNIQPYSPKTVFFPSAVTCVLRVHTIPYVQQSSTDVP